MHKYIALMGLGIFTFYFNSPSYAAPNYVYKDGLWGIAVGYDGSKHIISDQKGVKFSLDTKSNGDRISFYMMFDTALVVMPSLKMTLQGNYVELNRDDLYRSSFSNSFNGALAHALLHKLTTSEKFCFVELGNDVCFSLRGFAESYGWLETHGAAQDIGGKHIDSSPSPVFPLGE